MQRKIISIILIIQILILIVLLCCKMIEERNIKLYNYINENIKAEKSVNLENSIETDLNDSPKEYPKEYVNDKYKGYLVCARLEIPKIKLTTDIIENFSKEALNVSVTKLYGSNPNSNGNFCVIGHNFKKNNMFSNLKKLEVGDKLFLIDKKIGRVEYEIFDIDIVLPEQVECLEPVTDNEKEITLITCTYDSKKRIIVKAKEI